jgi:hypothetical protein
MPRNRRSLTSANSPKTFSDYARSFRLIVSQAFDIKDKGNARYDYRTGGRDEWIRRIESIKLSDVTPDRIQRWKVAYIKRKGGNPLKDRVARNSFNSVLRQAKSLFSPDRIRSLNYPQPFNRPLLAQGPNHDNPCGIPAPSTWQPWRRLHLWSYQRNR